MKKIFTIILFAVCCLKANNIKAQSVINNGFEYLNSDGTLKNWGNVYLTAMWFDTITGQFYSDSIVNDGAYYYAPTADAHSGTTALELRNSWNYTINAGIAGAVGLDDDSIFSSWGAGGTLIPTYATPFNPFSPFNFGFYYKYFPVNGDSAYASITLWDSTGNQLGEGIAIITTSSSVYTLISAPINYIMSGDVAFYSFFISNFYTADPGSRQPGFGTRLLVDNIQFNFASTSVNEENNNNQFINIYPNPSQDYITINSGIIQTTPYKIRNMFGQLVMEGKLETPSETISLQNLDAGVYYIEMIVDNRRISNRFLRR
ncbi:MAG: T9SS type A sorting domain-containing protein [Bacteroidota bacterium]